MSNNKFATNATPVTVKVERVGTTKSGSPVFSHVVPSPRVEYVIVRTTGSGHNEVLMAKAGPVSGDSWGYAACTDVSACKKYSSPKRAALAACQRFPLMKTEIVNVNRFKSQFQP